MNKQVAISRSILKSNGAHAKSNIVVLTDQEIFKNRIFGMPMTKMTRHQRVAFTIMIKIAYGILQSTPEQKTFSCDTKKFLEMLGISKKRKGANIFTKIVIDDFGAEKESDDYSLEKMLKGLLTKQIDFRYKDQKNKIYKVEATVLLSGFSLTREKIVFEFSEWIRNNISVVNNAYIIKEKTLAKLTKGYSVALFEQLEQRRSFEYWKVNFLLFRRLLGIGPDEYSRLYNLKVRVIQPAINELIKKTDYENIEFGFEKNGKEVENIFFSWKIKKK